MTNYDMTAKIIFISITLSVAWRRVGGSVVGITYRDDFDFERRYHRVHECDPFYWHPLHLPEECADMYEKLIRSRLPVRFAEPPSDPYRPIPVPPISPVVHAYEPFQYQHSGGPFYQTEIGVEVESVEPEVRELTPYEEMLESIQKDVNNFPSIPTVKDMPNFGPVAVYQQPVSQISADMIKNVAMTYVHSVDDIKGKKRDRGGKGRGKWKELVNKVHQHEQKGWKKINNGDIVAFSPY